ncbi:hypothetical protein D3C86_1877320 [compost metagenome]
MRRIEFTAEQFVAQAGPGRLALQIDGQTILLGKPLSGGDNHRGGIGQGHEAQIQYAFFRCRAAGSPSLSIDTAIFIFAHGAFPRSTQKDAAPMAE